MSKKQNEFHIIIDSNRIQKEYFKDLFRYQELFYFFIWRDILVRYKQTILGILWSLLRPILYMGIFVLVFGKIANLDSGHISYPLFILAGMLPWQLFASCVLDNSVCLVNNAPLISKVYFPRIILPVNYIALNFADFMISLGMLFVYMGIKGELYHGTLLLLPLFIILVLLLCLGSSLWLSALMVRYRDFRFIVPFIIQFGMFLSPVGYSSAFVSENWRWLYFLNPMAGVIEGFRWSCFGMYQSYLPLAIGLSVLMICLILITGFFFFRKMERIFADII